MILPTQKEMLAHNKYSQHGEEVLLAKIFEQIGTVNKYFVDYGAGDGFNLSNTRIFLEQGWKGLLMDGFHETPHVKKEIITPNNILELFAKYNVPNQFDLLSQDLDSCDYQLLEKILPNYKPSVIICEFNPAFQDEMVYLEYEELYIWDGTDKYGFSFEAGKYLLGKFNYHVIWQNECNIVAVHDDYIDTIPSVTHKKRIVHPHNPNAKWITV